MASKGERKMMGCIRVALLVVISTCAFAQDDSGRSNVYLEQIPVNFTHSQRA